MPRHVVVDGSNLATEGRSLPSLKQLSDAVNAFIAENPTDLITVVVDATFGHRIDAKEVPEFEAAIEHNELVAPPAGAVGRGDAFVLSIANKVNAIILSNDSFQEFHPDYPWLFDEGRLVGGKPVPHVGWVFVKRNPVRGPVSRRATRESKAKSSGGAVDNRKASKAASLPMPVPSAPPPGAVLAQKPSAGRGRGRGRNAAAAETAAATAPSPVAAVQAAAAASPNAAHVNQLLPFIAFVEKHPVGTSVNAIVESYSSHGAYVTIGDVRGYVPLRLMAEPAPRSAREAMKIGESVTLVVVSFAASRRSIDLAVPHLSAAAITALASEAEDAEAAAKPAQRTSRSRSKAAAKPDRSPAPAAAPAAAAPSKKTAAKKAPAKKAPAKKAAAVPTPAVAPVAKTAAKKSATAPAPKAPAKKAAAKAAPAPATATAPAAKPAKAPAAQAPSKKVPAKKAAAVTAPASKAPVAKAPVAKAPAAKAPAATPPAKKAAAKKPAAKAPAKKAAAKAKG